MALLVAYGTVRGSTREIAQRIGDGIAAAHQGLRVEVRPAGEVQGLGRYDGLVVGSALHDGAWLPEVMAFVRANVDVMGTMPVWAFSVSTVGETSAALAGPAARLARRLRRGWIPAVQHREVDAVDHRSFAGVIRREDWSRPGHVVFRLLGGRYGDHRDWADIDAWAVRIGGEHRARRPFASRVRAAAHGHAG